MINNNDNIDKIAFAFFSSLVICSILNDSYLIVNNFFKNSYIKKKISYLTKIYKVIVGLSTNNYKNDDNGNIILEIDEIKSTNPFDYTSDINDLELLKKEINTLNNQVLEDLNEELENDNKIKLCINRKNITNDNNKNCNDEVENNDIEDNEIENDNVENDEIENDNVEDYENNDDIENDNVEDYENNDVENNNLKNNDTDKYDNYLEKYENNKDNQNLENYKDNIIIEKNNLIENNIIEDKKIKGNNLKKTSKKNKSDKNDNILIKYISNKKHGDLIEQDQDIKNKKLKKTKKSL